MSIEVQDISKQYGRQLAVDHLSFSAKQGEIVGFLGPNGAGKSTTMKIAAGYLSPTAGTVSICGFDVLAQPIEARRNIGYLPEHNPLYTDMYVREYLQFAGSLFGIRGSRLQQRVSELIELCGITPEQHKKIGALSKGYRQRIGLAQALIHDPAVLILDEPTTGLDPNQIVDIRRLIRETGKNKTIIFSTHIMQEVQALCDRIIIISHGRIAADNRMEDIAGVSGQAVISIEFATDMEEASLMLIPGVAAISRTGPGKYMLRMISAADPRAAIMQIAAAHSWPLLGLSREESSLESIFQSLTRDPRP